MSKALLTGSITGPILAHPNELIHFPTSPALWLATAGIATVAYLLCRYRTWLAIVVVPLSIAYPGALLLALHSAPVSQRMRTACLGITYGLQVELSLAIVFAALAIGLLQAPPQAWQFWVRR